MSFILSSREVSSYRVPVSSILQFAQLAINSNEHHPAHHRHSSTSPPPPSPYINRWDLHHFVHSTLSSLLPPSTPFPLPLTSLILDYCLLHSFVSGEANGQYRLWSAQGDPLALLDTPHTDYASSVTCLPHSDTIVTGSRDGHLHLFRQQLGGAQQWGSVGPHRAQARGARARVGFHTQPPPRAADLQPPVLHSPLSPRWPPGGLLRAHAGRVRPGQSPPAASAGWAHS